MAILCCKKVAAENECNDRWICRTDNGLCASTFVSDHTCAKPDENYRVKTLEASGDFDSFRIIYSRECFAD